MLGTGTVAEDQGFPHGIGGADDVIAMPRYMADWYTEFYRRHYADFGA